MRGALPVLAVGVALALGACGRSGPRTKPEDFRHGALPPGWERTKVGGMAIAYYHKEYGATAGVAPVCDGISDTSLEALAQQELIGIEQRETISESRTLVDGREAVDWVVKGSVDGVEMRVNIVVFRKEDCVYDLNLVSRPETFEKARQDFRQFVEGFALVAKGAGRRGEPGTRAEGEK